MESVNERLIRLGMDLEGFGENRLQSLEIANTIVNDETFKILATANRLNRRDTIVLPMHRLETKSRGRGWARKGRGTAAEWGEREPDGYRVGPGFWIVGGHDGFSRKAQTEWTVKHVQVGDKIWTIAD